MLTTTLSWHELMAGAQAGCFRHVEDIIKERKDRYGARRNVEGWKIDIQGALCELALAKVLGLYWAGKGVLGAPDVGEHQARSITKSHHSLLLHPDDDDNRRYYLVHYSAPRFAVIGFILGKDGKQKKWWADPKHEERWAYFVPQSALNVSNVDMLAGAGVTDMVVSSDGVVSAG